jgi:hypothetical protein
MKPEPEFHLVTAEMGGEDDLTEFAAAGIAKLEALLAKYAEFHRLHGND